MFENIHRNKKLAYLDGLLCGLTIAYYANLIRKEYEEDKPFREAMKNVNNYHSNH